MPAAPAKVYHFADNAALLSGGLFANGHTAGVGGDREERAFIEIGSRLRTRDGTLPLRGLALRDAMGGFVRELAEVALAEVGGEADLGGGSEDAVEVIELVVPHPCRPVYRGGRS